MSSITTLFHKRKSGGIAKYTKLDADTIVA